MVDLREIDQAHVAAAGGKAAHLGELMRIDGVRVPPGFCVTADAFRAVAAAAPSLDQRLARLSRLDPGDGAAIGALSGEIRRTIEATPLPDPVAAAIRSALGRLGERAACAVRSSATAEDSPGASFAGQHDTYLGVVGPAAILQHVVRCWASLWTERSVTYRLRNGFDEQRVAMAVVVQRLVPADASGVLFTADPVTSNRTIASVEATPGLGEALVSGHARGDAYRVRDGRVIGREVAPERPRRPVLTEPQVLELVRLGRRIEAHFGRPQDIEWCLAAGRFHVVQSRPITTLFPIPEVGDGGRHVFVSVGHQQMMTDAIRPLGISVWQLTALRPMYHAGGRLFVDVSPELASAATRTRIVEGFGKADPLTGDALRNVVQRSDLVPTLPAADPAGPPPVSAPPLIAADPSLVAGLIARAEASIAALKHDLRDLTGPALLDFILEDIKELRRMLTDPQSGQAIRAGMEASWWLDDHLETWLGEKNAAAAIAQSVPNNITSEMGLALLGVADAVRRHPAAAAVLEQAENDPEFLERLHRVEGGREVRDAIGAFLERYGMRCAGEIDITRTRWSERPATLVPVILAHVRNFEPGAAERQFEEGLRAAQAKERELLERLRALPDGARKAEETKAMIDRVRTFMGYREYPKYAIVSRYFVYKQALLREAERLVAAGVLRQPDDIFYLTFAELRDTVLQDQVDGELIRRRREEFRSHQALTPPRVLTSDGEVVAGAYRREDLPAGALAGLAVSAGVVEGRARVIHELGEAGVEPGDILVTAYTDPSWTPLFVTVSGLVTEVGGLMTHGSVIAREYGLPAVVGVESATRLIRDGQRIRVHGTDGYVEMLD